MLKPTQKVIMIPPEDQRESTIIRQVPAPAADPRIWYQVRRFDGQIIGMPEDCLQIIPEWQREFPDEDGAWWFFGTVPREVVKDLFVMMVHKTANNPPKPFAFWNGHMYLEDDIEGWWMKILTPNLPR